MNGDVHVRFCERPGVRLPRATHLLVHCRTQSEAERLRRVIAARLAQCRLAVHPQKTKVVYCKDSNRPGGHTHESFDFLGFSFRPRRVRNRDGRYFVSFSPAVSRTAAKAMRQTMRRHWKIPRRTDKDLTDLARMFSPTIRGWILYYGAFRRSELTKVFGPLDWALSTWAMRKYKRFKGHRIRASKWLQRVAERDPQLFAHWAILRPAAAGR